MSKSILFTILSLFSLSANAEYMGLDQVPVSSDNVNTVFLAAVKDSDFKGISSWAGQIKQVYDQKEFCGFATGYGYPATKVDPKVLQYDTAGSQFADVMSYQYASIVPSQCDSVSLWTLYNHLNFYQYSYDVFKSADAMGDLNKDHIQAADNFESQRKVILDFLDKIPNDKYQLFLPIIFQKDTDFKINNLAFDKYLEGKKNNAGNKDPKDLETQFYDKFKEALTTNKEWTPSFNDQLYLSLFKPDYLILTEMNKRVMSSLHTYWEFYKNSKGRLPAFNKEIIAKGGFTDDEVKNLHLAGLGETTLFRFYNTNQTIRLFHRAFQNFTDNHNDLNYQMADGNTLFSVMFKDDSRYTITDNPFGGSFIRFYLENGANPLLQNKDNDTAFSQFIKNYGDHDDTTEIKKAFVEKKYDFDPSILNKKN